MTQAPIKPRNEDLVKFVLPKELKQELLRLAASRNLSLSSLLRLIVTEYVRSKK